MTNNHNHNRNRNNNEEKPVRTGARPIGSIGNYRRRCRRICTTAAVGFWNVRSLPVDGRSVVRVPWPRAFPCNVCRSSRSRQRDPRVFLRFFWGKKKITKINTFTTPVFRPFPAAVFRSRFSRLKKYANRP